jgi:uncharacterized RDD family membrane protein YckC
MTDSPATSAAIVAADQRLAPPTVGIGFWPRAGARVLDVLFVMLLAFPAGIVAAIVLLILQVAGVTDDGWAVRMQESTVANYVFGAFAGVAFHAASDTLVGATPGKLVFRMRVVNLDGRRCGVGAALVRNLAYFVDSFFFGVPAYSSMQRGPEQQRYGDRWAKTMVISADEARLHQPAAASRVIFGVLASCIIAGAVTATGVIVSCV